jgi:nucleotide-binding universal stress UspA family protein
VAAIASAPRAGPRREPSVADLAAAGPQRAGQAVMMKLATNILVATDFGETAELALDYAVLLAAKLDAKVHVVHAIWTPELGIPELGVAVASMTMERLVREGRGALDQLLERHHGRARFGEAFLRNGDARDVVLQASHELAIDLIVMGTHGRQGLSRALLGSVAETVVRSARCPVLTVGAKAVWL